MPAAPTAPALGNEAQRGRNCVQRLVGPFVSVIGDPDAASDRDSSGPKQHRLYPQKGILASASQRGRRKTARWPYLGDAKTQIQFYPDVPNLGA